MHNEDRDIVDSAERIVNADSKTRRSVWGFETL